MPKFNEFQILLREDIVSGKLIQNWTYIQGESKKTDTFDIQMNNKGVSFFWLTLYMSRYSWWMTIAFLVRASTIPIFSNPLIVTAGLWNSETCIPKTKFGIISKTGNLSISLCKFAGKINLLLWKKIVEYDQRVFCGISEIFILIGFGKSIKNYKARDIYIRYRIQIFMILPSGQSDYLNPWNCGRTSHAQFHSKWTHHLQWAITQLSYQN